MADSTAIRPLHIAYPVLAGKIPHVGIADLPTPVARLDDQRIRLFVKQDDKTSTLYGGNKVRKLEYLLAQAIEHGCHRVATLGSAGSNHATATALHARALGLTCINFLSHQHATPWIAPNLRAQIGSGARIVFVGGGKQDIRRIVHETLQTQSGKTWLIPTGGSSCTGTLGYVNAAFELAAQIAAGELPEPDCVYLPLGTMGTAVGLCIGLRAAGIGATVIAVRVVHQSVGSTERAQRLFQRTARLLHGLDPRFPHLDFDTADFHVREDQFGSGYAHATDAAEQALSAASTRWRLELETTYSAKTLAALLRDARGGTLDGKTVLFWNTYNSTPLAMASAGGEPGAMAEELRRYLNATDRDHAEKP